MSQHITPFFFGARFLPSFLFRNVALSRKQRINLGARVIYNVDLFPVFGYLISFCVFVLSRFCRIFISYGRSGVFYYLRRACREKCDEFYVPSDFQMTTILSVDTACLLNFFMPVERRESSPVRPKNLVLRASGENLQHFQMAMAGKKITLFLGAGLG
jgi:hypothetical protein